MAAPRLATFVHVVSPEGVSCAFGPDDDVPDWAAEKITNSKVWAEEPESDDDGYGSMTVADLKVEIEKRNEVREDDALLPVDGKKADLVAVLEADDQSA